MSFDGLAGWVLETGSRWLSYSPLAARNPDANGVSLRVAHVRQTASQSSECGTEKLKLQ